MGENDSLTPKAKKAIGSPTFVALVALALGAGGASAVTITFGGKEGAQSVTSYEMDSIKKTQEKHDARISQNEQGMITVRIAITGIEKEMKNQTEKIDDIKDTGKRIDERSRNGRRNRDDE